MIFTNLYVMFMSSLEVYIFTCFYLKLSVAIHLSKSIGEYESVLHQFATSIFVNFVVFNHRIF